MASDLERSTFSSAPKRIKLDNPNVQCNSRSEIDNSSFSASFTVPDSSSKREVGVSSELKRKSPDDTNESIRSEVDNDQNESRDGGLEDDDDDVSSTVSNLSDLSGLSDISGQEWKPIAGPMSWVQKQMMNGVNPRTLLSHMMGDNSHVSTQVDDLTLWKIIVSMLSEPPTRFRLRDVNSLNDVVRLLTTCSRIIVLTGAGVSVSCGIPDFRSRNGIYSRLAVDFPNLPDPQAMFDINFFRQDPRPFFKFAREIYPGLFKPSPCHRFIKMLEKQKKLLRNYTQNIDTLEQVAGISNVIECHGSFATATCTVCGHKVTAEDIRADVFQQKIPYCPVCPANAGLTRGLLKPDIVFFGEGLPDSFHSAMAADKDACDLLIVIGSSLKVRPVALIPSSIPTTVPQILINRERLPHLNFDVELYGDSDIIIDQICRMLGGCWSEVCWRDSPLSETSQLLPPPPRYSTNVSNRGFVSSDYGRSDTYESERERDREMSVDRHETEDHEMEDHRQGGCQDEGCQDDVSAEPQRVGRIKRPPVDVEEGMSVEVESNEAEDGGDRAGAVSRRHLSLDSTRDSGIGDGSNSSHSHASGSAPNGRHMSVESESDAGSAAPTLANRLPEHTYYRVDPNRYVFPGAELPDEIEADDDEDNSSVADLSEVESEGEATPEGETEERPWPSQ